MERKFMKKILISLILVSLGASVASAQNADGKSEEEKMYEFVQEQVEALSSLLELDAAQEFYVDSILTHDFGEMQAEINAMNKSKVMNSDLYVQVQDRWREKMYVAFEKILAPEQWEKYLKSGALRDKKGRDKRAAKAGK